MRRCPWVIVVTVSAAWMLTACAPAHVIPGSVKAPSSGEATPAPRTTASLAPEVAGGNPSYPRPTFPVAAISCGEEPATYVDFVRGALAEGSTVFRGVVQVDVEQSVLVGVVPYPCPPTRGSGSRRA
jgi:hypothetical protein